jgi:alpha-tubulin suppressor-like RCC1 family protein
VFSWGNGADGKLGHGDESEQLIPMQIGILSNKKVTSVACGSEHSCVIADDALYTWGKGQYGRLGHGSEKSEKLPKVVEALNGKGLKEVICGSEFTIVLTGNKSIVIQLNYKVLVYLHLDMEQTAD